MLNTGNQYTISEMFKTAYSLVLTKLCFKQARLVRRPIYIRGKNSLSGCKTLTTGRFCRFDLEGNKKTLFIGDNCELGDMTHIVAHEKVVFGDNVLVASKCFISDTNHGTYRGERQDGPDTIPNERHLTTAPVLIGDNVWIGENVVILAGVVIGSGCIIGANSVITKSVANNSMVVGNNVVIKTYNETTKKWESQED